MTAYIHFGGHMFAALTGLWSPDYTNFGNLLISFKTVKWNHSWSCIVMWFYNIDHAVILDTDLTHLCVFNLWSLQLWEVQLFHRYITTLQLFPLLLTIWVFKNSVFLLMCSVLVLSIWLHHSEWDLKVIPGLMNLLGLSGKKEGELNTAGGKTSSKCQ